MDLKDKVVIITGGTKGLGRALANIFVERGARVVVCARDISQIPDEMVGKVLVVKCNVAHEKEVKQLADQVIKQFGRIDIWINNAGLWLPHAVIEDMDLKRVHEMVEVNLFGTIYGSKYALLQMKKQKEGVIISILSTSALTGRPKSSGYCASKYAATGFTKSLRLEVVDDNIKVLNIYPGGMQSHFFDEKPPQDFSKYMDTHEVAEKIVTNLESDNPEEEQIIKRVD